MEMAVESKNLYYAFPDESVGLFDINLKLPHGSRTLLIGANGAGKTTLLRVLAGKTLTKAGSVIVDGRDPFRDVKSDTTYLGTEWASNTTVRRDVPVTLLIASVGGDAYPDRRDLLVDILDIDLTWRMHAVSDGERRRVQLCMGLLRPWTTLLLDEVTVDLDVLVRSRLLQFLKSETDNRQCQVIYATHIFDGLTGWPTHIVHMDLGKIAEIGSTEELLEAGKKEGLIDGSRGSPLLELALSWLKSDLEKRGKRERKTWESVKGSIGLSLDHADRFSSYFQATRR